MSRRNALVLFHNAASGHGDARALRERIGAILRAAGERPDFVLREEGRSAATAACEAAARAARRGATLVAIGGDGTVNVATAAVLEHGVPLALVPTGTFNFAARAHGVPERLEDALALALDGRARETRVARMNARPFMVNASIGLYAKLLSERESFKRLLGRRRAVATLAAAVSALRPYRPLELAIVARGVVRRSSAATFIVGNNRLQLELVGVADLPDPARPELGAMLLHPVGRAALLAMIWRGWRGEVHETRALESFLFDAMTVDVPDRRARRITVAIDGEIVREALPLVFSAHERPLMLVRPPR